MKDDISCPINILLGSTSDDAFLDCACSGRDVFLPHGGMAQDGSFRTAPGDYDSAKTKAALQLWEDGKRYWFLFKLLSCGACIHSIF